MPRSITSMARATLGMGDPVEKDAGGQDAPSRVGESTAPQVNVDLRKLRGAKRAAMMRRASRSSGVPTPVTRQRRSDAAGRRAISSAAAAAPAPAPAPDLAPLVDAVTKLAARPVVVQAPAPDPQRLKKVITHRDPETDLIISTEEVWADGS
jgi:hypothetical protein